MKIGQEIVAYAGEYEPGASRISEDRYKIEIKKKTDLKPNGHAELMYNVGTVFKIEICPGLFFALRRLFEEIAYFEAKNE